MFIDSHIGDTYNSDQVLIPDEKYSIPVTGKFKGSSEISYLILTGKELLKLCDLLKD